MNRRAIWLFMLTSILLPACKPASGSDGSIGLLGLLGLSGSQSTPSAASSAGLLLPQFSPAPGSYSSDRSITITSPNAGATIRYTIDGSTPSAASPSYSAAVPILGDGTTITIKAVTEQNGQLSAVAEGSWSIHYPAVAGPGTVQSPRFAPSPGNFASDQLVTIFTWTDGATIHYTTNGNDPTVASPVYSAPISVAGNGTSTIVKAMATKSGMSDSPVYGGTYSINYAQVASPQFSPIAGSYNAGQTITLTSSTTGALIYYSTDGSDPVAGVSPLYSAPIALTRSMTLKAIAVKQGLLPSAVGSGDYVQLSLRTLGGSVNGLLSGDTVELRSNLGDTITVAANGSFTFPTAYLAGSSYYVSLSSQGPQTQCVIRNDAGVVGSQNVTSVVVDCPMVRKNGLLWMRCSQGQVWNSTVGDCTGTGIAATYYGAAAVTYCATNDNACNDTAGAAPDTGAVIGHLNGSGNSGAYSACQSLNTANNGDGTYGRTTWRVPRKDELKGLVLCTTGAFPLNDYPTNPWYCGWNGSTYVTGYQVPAIDTAAFPSTPPRPHWTDAAAGPNSITAWRVDLASGVSYSQDSKATPWYVRCVSNGP